MKRKQCEAAGRNEECRREQNNEGTNPHVTVTTTRKNDGDICEEQDKWKTENSRVKKEEEQIRNVAADTLVTIKT